MRSWFSSLVALVLVACSSTSSSSSVPAASSAEAGGGGGGAQEPLACAQKEADGSDDDCVAHGKPRKLDCASRADLDAALAAGCVREDPADSDDYDVCCDTTIRGTKAVTVTCRQKPGADTDSDCAGRTASPRKLDCASASDSDEALAAGCVRVAPDDDDVCCPTTVEGTP